MKLAGILLASLALVCAGQAPRSQNVTQPGGFQGQMAVVQTPTPAAPQFDRVAVGTLEGDIEHRVTALDVNDSFQLMGACTGVHVDGYGMVFTLPIALATTPAASPFRGPLTKDEMAGVHKRKLAHLPVLRKAMREMLVNAFNALPKLPPNEKIALGVRVFYLAWEDRTQLPVEIVYSADRASALAGNIQTDEQ